MDNLIDAIDRSALLSSTILFAFGVILSLWIIVQLPLHILLKIIALTIGTYYLSENGYDLVPLIRRNG